jgi:peptidylprolyl isomerase
MITEWHDGPKIPAPSDVENAPADAARMPSGLVTKVLRYGTGTEHPQSGARVVVRYSGWTIDGAMFDSSVTRGTPAKLPVDGVIEGFSEGLKLMVVGEQRRLWIPSILAYGAKPGRPHGTLVFDVELVAIEQP